MKAQVVIGDGWRQIVFRPDTTHEADLLKMVGSAPAGQTEIKYGSWFVEECQGGWFKQFSNSAALLFTIHDKPKKSDWPANDPAL